MFEEMVRVDNSYLFRTAKIYDFNQVPEKL